MTYEQNLNKPRFTDFNQLYSWLVDQGSSYTGDAVLLSKTDFSIIGRWGYVEGLIVPLSVVNFTKIKATQWGNVTSVAGDILTLTVGYIWTDTSDIDVRAIDTTALAELGEAPDCTRVGDQLDVGATLALAINTALGLGHTVLVLETKSEFQIGGITRDIILTPGASFYFTGTGYSGIGKAIQVWAGKFRHCRLELGLISYTALNAREDRILVGFANTGHLVAGICRNDTNVRSFISYSSTLTETLIGAAGGGSGVSGVQSYTGIVHTYERDDLRTGWIAIISLLAGTYVNSAASNLITALNNGYPYINTNLGAVFSYLKF
jgi:hypothetical protein